MFEQARLVTRDNGFVAMVAVPLFKPPADVLLWGGRCFVYRDISRGHITYREAMMWPVIEKPLGFDATYEDDKANDD